MPTESVIASSRSQIRMKLIGANPAAKLDGREQLASHTNYLIGNDAAKWQTDVPMFARVEQRAVYDGIDLVYYGNQQQLEYDFKLAPQADPHDIKLAFAGVEKLKIDERGDLVLSVGDDEVRQHKPLVYQAKDGARREVAARYVLRGQREVGFEVGAYDRMLPLVIDPILSYATYLGGSASDYGYSIAVDGSGNAYITGQTFSTNFPTQNAYQGALNGNNADVFVTKFNPSGTAIIYSTYIGGGDADMGNGIAVDASGNAYVVGRTNSVGSPTSSAFPTTAGSFASTYRGGDFDAFAFKLNAQGNNLAYSTFLGGSDNDSAVGLAVDVSGNAYVTGGARSFDFPTTSTAYQPSNNGSTDAYILKLNATGSALLYSTYFGGSGTDRGSQMAVDPSGNATLVGYTNSVDFPTQDATQPDLAGNFDVFIAKFNADASALTYSTYLGGAGDDKGYGVALDTGGNAYLTGQTASNNFPTLNPYQPAFSTCGTAPCYDAFVTKLSQAGALAYSTYLGGANDDRGLSIAVNANGNAYVAGFTASTNFPVKNPSQGNNAGSYDAFVAKLNAAGNALSYSTYYGGSSSDSESNNITYSGGLALDSAGNAYIAGFTFSTNLPTMNPYQATNHGNNDAFIAKLGAHTVSAGEVLISEFRARGPNGLADCFVELYNNTDAPISVSTTDNSGGWSLVSTVDTTTPRFLIPNDTLIPARGHYLAGGSAYSLASYAAADTVMSNIGDNQGLAFFRTQNSASFNSTNLLDAVGFSGNPAPYTEGTPLASISAINNEASYVRNSSIATNLPQDTNNNAADFTLVATNGNATLTTATLGAPGPENLASPVLRNALTPSLIDPLTCGACTPNRVRNGSGNSGTLIIRRRFTNNTGATVTRLRFRVIDITTLGSPPVVADLRLANSSDETVSTSLGSAFVQGTTIEQPPLQPNGGGLNTSLTTALPAGGLANGQSLNVQFTTNVIAIGRFRFYISVEALP